MRFPTERLWLMVWDAPRVNGNDIMAWVSQGAFRSDSFVVGIDDWQIKKVAGEVGRDMSRNSDEINLLWL